MMKETSMHDTEIQQFIKEGFVRIDNAFPKKLAEEGRSILWKDTVCSENDPENWKHPVIRLGDYNQKPFRKAANTQVLHASFNGR